MAILEHTRRITRKILWLPGIKGFLIVCNPITRVVSNYIYADIRSNGKSTLSLIFHSNGPINTHGCMMFIIKDALSGMIEKRYIIHHEITCCF